MLADDGWVVICFVAGTFVLAEVILQVFSVSSVKFVSMLMTQVWVCISP